MSLLFSFAVSELILDNIYFIAFCLVFWPEEMQVSVVARGTLQEGNIVGDSCSVTVGRQVHKGSILAIGIIFKLIY